jgi:hypothetical protein
MLDAHAEALLRRLKAGLPVAQQRPAFEPRDGEEAVRLWWQATGKRRGSVRSPPARVLAEAVRRYGEGAGWARVPTRQEVGRALAALGVKRCQPPGYWLHSEDARALWLLAESLGVRPYVRPSRRPGRRRREWTPRPVRRGNHRGGKPRALASCDGRTWESGDAAGRALGVAGRTIRQAVRDGGTVAGLHWRAVEGYGSAHVQAPAPAEGSPSPLPPLPPAGFPGPPGR